MIGESTKRAADVGTPPSASPSSIPAQLPRAPTAEDRAVPESPAPAVLRARLDLGADVLARARADAATRGIGIARSLAEASGLPSSEFVYALATALRYPIATNADLRRWQPAFDLLPLAEALRHQCVPFRDERGMLRLVTDDPFDSTRLAWGDARLRRAFTWALASREDLSAFLAALSQPPSDAVATTAAPPTNTAAPTAETPANPKTSPDHDDPISRRLLAATLNEAERAGATDVHFESAQGALVIRYRIDGELEEITRLPGADLAQRIVSRIRSLAATQPDDRMILTNPREGHEAVYFVSMVTTRHGVDVTLHRTDSGRAAETADATLSGLGFDAHAAAVIRRAALAPSGVLLVLGPARSGKSATLAAIASETRGAREKSIDLDGIDFFPDDRVGVIRAAASTRDRKLLAMLNHDVDRIIVGDIDDAPIAQQSLAAAQRGARLLATIDANDTLDALSRFAAWGVDAAATLAATNAIVTQRLVRLNCVHCAVDVQPPAALLTQSGLTPEGVARFRFRAGRGCERCRRTGFRGRRLIYDVAMLDDEMRRTLWAFCRHRDPATGLRRAFARALRRQALDLVQAGATTLQEINRVTVPD